MTRPPANGHSPEASYITGSVLVAGGGWLAG
jgi:hypothetical protein